MYVHRYPPDAALVYDGGHLLQATWYTSHYIQIKNEEPGLKAKPEITR